jgi:hypothetical protein
MSLPPDANATGLYTGIWPLRFAQEADRDLARVLRSEGTELLLGLLP